jgi:hypothetical protein
MDEIRGRRLLEGRMSTNRRDRPESRQEHLPKLLACQRKRLIVRLVSDELLERRSRVIRTYLERKEKRLL